MKQRQIPWSYTLLTPWHLGYFAMVVMSFLFSCTKKEPEPDCGCESKRIIGKVIQGKARYAGNGIFQVIDEGAFEVQRLFSACKIDPNWTISKQGVTDYVISGHYKEQCLPPNLAPPFVSTYPIDLTSIVPPKN